jgi:ATP-dependent RNA helicase RhlE
MGFLPDIRRIIKLLPKRRQTLFFSATMPEDIRKLSDSILHNPATVQIGMIAPAETVSHALYPVQNGLKKKLLLAMLQQTATGRVLIFTRTKRRARFLARDLEKLRYRVSALQGNMSQNRRQQAINGFRNGKFDILVATDIAARGIDVSEISHVINYDMPDTVDAYTHRIGRTGRVERSGEAFTLAVPDDAPMVRAIEKVLKARIERRSLPGFDYSGFDPEKQFQQRGNHQRRQSSRPNQKSRHRRSQRKQFSKPHRQHPS